jgi:hypothetical protein
LVSGFGPGAYSAKLFAGIKQRLAGFNQPCNAVTKCS